MCSHCESRGGAGPEQSSDIRGTRVWVLDVVRGDASRMKAIILNLWPDVIKNAACNYFMRFNLPLLSVFN